VADRPNIIFFDVDNLAMGELGCYGGGILRGADTKRIDRFASESERTTIQAVTQVPDAVLTRLGQVGDETL
jgi:arylsulfatase A-like enzyme